MVLARLGGMGTLDAEPPGCSHPACGAVGLEASAGGRRDRGHYERRVLT